MSAHNWVFLREEDDFEANFELLIDALDTDLAYIREPTRLLTRAIEWHDNNRRRSNILRGLELTAAEGWLAISESMQPPSTGLHAEYISFSRATIRRLQRLVISSAIITFVLVLRLAIFAFYQRQKADNQRAEAEEAARISQSNALAAFALMELKKILN